MATQREIPYTGKVPCTCGKIPRAYVTDFTKYHIECYPCQHITMRLSSVEAANTEFSRMMGVKRADDYNAAQVDLAEVEARVHAYFDRGSRA